MKFGRHATFLLMNLLVKFHIYRCNINACITYFYNLIKNNIFLLENTSDGSKLRFLSP